MMCLPALVQVVGLAHVLVLSLLYHIRKVSHTVKKSM